MTTQEVAKLVAKAVLQAQDIREASWRGSYYMENEWTSAQQSAAANNVREFTEVIYMLLRTAWNDAQDWANQNK